jgi:hypothetical protein
MAAVAVWSGAKPARGAVAEHKRSGLQAVLGERYWQRLPATVRERFAEPAKRVDYVGSFETVRASLLGRAIALVCRLIGTPVAPRVGRNVAAIVHVDPVPGGVAWNREYRWPQGGSNLVRSTKTIDVTGRLVERLPAGLCMPLEVFECEGVLHFVSDGYYFEWRGHRLPLPRWLAPGTTHVQHIDENDGWFRFTMSVTHPLFGEIFFQTGRFRAAARLLS